MKNPWRIKRMGRPTPLWMLIIAYTMDIEIDSTDI